MAEDLGDYYRVPADNRDLNYNLYFSEGSPKAAQVDGYDSNNTRRLDVDGMMKLLLQLEEVRAAMRSRGLEVPQP